MSDVENLVALEIYFQKTELLVTFILATLGIAFGNLTIKGVGFGSSGVLIAAMVAGYFFQFEPVAILANLGIVLFLLCVGLEAGPSFFRAFKQHGGQFIANVLVLLAVSGVNTVAIIALSGIPVGIGLGLFAGVLHLQSGTDQRTAVQSRERGDFRLRRRLSLRSHRRHSFHKHLGAHPPQQDGR